MEIEKKNLTYLDLAEGSSFEGPSPETATLFARAFQASPWNKAYTLEEASHILNVLSEPENSFVVLARDGDRKLVGMAIASTEVCAKGAPYFDMKTLCVEPSVQEKGIGYAITKRVVEEAKERRLCFVEIATMKDSVAEQFYKRQGFIDATAPVCASGWCVMHLYLSKGTTSPRP